MALRKNLYTFFIWLAVIGFSIWIGGTIFSMCVVVPMWSESPETIKEFFGGTNFNKYILNFFAPWLGSIRLFPLLISLGLIWYSKKHRYYLLITLLSLLFTIIYTNIVIYPINDIMMTKAGAGKTAEEL
ncbi:MAG: hypothetical protein ABIO05_02375, partial [Ferruginibacter sp.]